MRRSRLLVLVVASVTVAALASAAPAAGATSSRGGGPVTTTPITHLVVIFQENVSFDHYFATYPHAANTDGTPFVARRRTPSVNGLSGALLTANPNGANPQRLTHKQALTCDQNHDYTPEQQAYDAGLVDQFLTLAPSQFCYSWDDATIPNQILDYYDGNTVTALWNYAQRFAMSDNSFSTVFGPSTPGALNLVSGQTGGATPATIADNTDNGTVYGDPDPTYDDCSGSPVVAMSGRNIGDLLSSKRVSWGWFQGGFRPTATNNGVAACGATSTNIGGGSVKEYSAHHEPFQYYASTSNRHHLPPASVDEIGHAGAANHQYDLVDFWASLRANKLPAVSFLKATKAQDGHAGYSDPLDEQAFLVSVLNGLQKSSAWRSTAVVIAYDDSDGFYDHVMPPIVNPSASDEDALNGPGVCGHGTPLAGIETRCGYGPRQPLLVISPYSRENAVDHALTDQTSILRFIEDNWQLPRIGGGSFDTLAGSLDGLFDWSHPNPGRLILDPSTGAKVDD